MGRSAGSSAARGAIAGVIPRWGRRCSPSLDPIRIAGLIQCGRAGGTACPTCRTPDVVEFGMSPISWRRHSCLLGRDSSRPSSRGASTVPERREESRRRRHECLRHVMAQVNFPTIRNPRTTSGVLSFATEPGFQNLQCPVQCLPLQTLQGCFSRYAAGTWRRAVDPAVV